MKAPWWRFSDAIDRTINFTPRGLGMSLLSRDNRDSTQRTNKDEIFMWKPNLEKNTERNERIHYFHEVTMNYVELYYVYNL